MYTSSTRIIDLTVGEFEAILQKYQQPAKNDTPTEIIRGLRNIAKILGISQKTLQRWRAERIITAPTIQQIHGVIIADKTALINFRVTNKNKQQNGR